MFLEKRVDTNFIRKIELESIENIKCLIELMRDHKLYAILHDQEFLKKTFPADLLPAFCDDAFENISRNYWDEFQKLVRIFSEAGLIYAIVKGVPLSELLYASPFARGIGDIDIVVPEENFEEAFYLLLSNGYYRPDEEDIREPVFEYGYNHHEILLEKIVNNITVDVEIKRRTSCTSSFKKWWPYITEKTIDKVKFYCLDSIHEIIHLFMNAFTNNEIFRIHQNCQLRDYFDVASVIQKAEVDWRVLLNFAESMEATHQIAAVLRSTKDLFPSIGQKAQELLDIIEREYCVYSQLPYYFGADHAKITNYSLVEDRPRADIAYSIFDRDFSMYQSLKSYKAVLYSKKNPDYQKRIRLCKNQVSDIREYPNTEGIRAKYVYFNAGDYFDIVIDIDKSCNCVFENNICDVSVLWYDIDINRPVLTSKSHSPRLTNLQSVLWDEIVSSKIDEQFFSSDRYLNLIHKKPPLKARIRSKQLDNSTRIIFEFKKDQLFYPLDVLLFEVKFNFWIHEDDEYEVELGGNTDFIECSFD